MNSIPVEGELLFGKDSIAGAWKTFQNSSQTVWLPTSAGRAAVCEELNRADYSVHLQIDPYISSVRVKRHKLIPENDFQLDGSMRAFLPVALDCGPATWSCTSRSFTHIVGQFHYPTTELGTVTWDLRLESGLLVVKAGNDKGSFGTWYFERDRPFDTGTLLRVLTAEDERLRVTSALSGSSASSRWRRTLETLHTLRVFKSKRESRIGCLSVFRRGEVQSGVHSPRG